MSNTLENPRIQISPQSEAVLRELAAYEGKPIQIVLDEAIEQYRRDKFFCKLDEGYVRLKADPKAWQEEQDERQLWETTLVDG
ncbi:MAG: toxin-antitoxin system protein [Bryobacteraceae bacterium]